MAEIKSKHLNETAIHALEETRDLWKRMGDFGIIKFKAAKNTPVQDYYALCPLCQFVLNINEGNHDCSLCPLSNEWVDKEALMDAFEDEGLGVFFDEYYDGANVEIGEDSKDVFCEKRDSPYAWYSLFDADSKEAQICAYLIADFCDKKIAKLKKELVNESSVD